MSGLREVAKRLVSPAQWYQAPEVRLPDAVDVLSWLGGEEAEAPEAVQQTLRRVALAAFDGGSLDLSTDLSPGAVQALADLVRK